MSDFGFLVIEAGIYRHGIQGVRATYEQAEQLARTYLEAESDDYHSAEIIELLPNGEGRRWYVKQARPCKWIKHEPRADSAGGNTYHPGRPTVVTVEAVGPSSRSADTPVHSPESPHRK